MRPAPPAASPRAAASAPAAQPAEGEPLEALGAHLGGVGAVDVRVDGRVGEAEDEEDVGEPRVDVRHGGLGVQHEPGGGGDEEKGLNSFECRVIVCRL